MSLGISSCFKFQSAHFDMILHAMKRFRIFLGFTSLVLFQLAIACAMTCIANTLNVRYMAWVVLVLWLVSVGLCIGFFAKNSMTKKILYSFSLIVSLLIYLIMDVVFNIFPRVFY